MLTEKRYHEISYIGHGQSKVVYLLPDGGVLKLCKGYDPEPEICQAGEASGVYPKVHGSELCRVERGAGRPAETWSAWVSDFATPVDSILKKHPGVFDQFCLLGAIHAMVTAFSLGHIMSDNDFYNFGIKHVAARWSDSSDF